MPGRLPPAPTNDPAVMAPATFRDGTVTLVATTWLLRVPDVTLAAGTLRPIMFVE